MILKDNHVAVVGSPSGHAESYALGVVPEADPGLGVEVHVEHTGQDMARADMGEDVHPWAVGLGDALPFAGAATIALAYSVFSAGRRRAEVGLLAFHAAIVHHCNRVLPSLAPLY